jgi:hypothetical protein
MANSLLRLVVVSAATVLAACSGDPLTWDPAMTAAGTALPGRLRLDSGGPQFTTDTTGLVPPSIPGACAGSARVALSGASGMERYVAWWAPRADSSAALLSARSTDGGRSWSAPEPVDTADHRPVGCVRPAPAIAADSSSGYVHVAYSMRDAQGAGIFFSHSMDRGKMFHWPVTITYGDHLTDVAIAVRGDTVAIAYIEPSSDHPQLGLALSHTMGHIFEDRLMVPSSSDASDPAVALAPGRIGVAWIHHIPGGATSLVTRIGRFGGSARP